MQTAMTRCNTLPAWCFAGLLVAVTPGPACALTAYVTNERDNTMSVIDLDQMKTVQTVPVGQRPRGITMTADGSLILVCASDDDTIQIIGPRRCGSSAIFRLGRIPTSPHVSGNPLYVSNEDDNMVTVIDLPTRKMIAEIPTGVEPEGMAVSPDGQTIVNTSETTNTAHFLDYQTRKMVAGVLVDARPRAAMFKHDGSEVWVSSELGGAVSVIDPVQHAVTHRITFDVQGLRGEAIQPVGIQFTRDDSTAFVAMGPANRVAVIDAKTYKVQKYLLVGQRVWQMAFTPDQKYLLTTNGLSNDISVIGVASIEIVKSSGRSARGVSCRRNERHTIADAALRGKLDPHRP
jgi:PQQ-dependent catabolism-associated beta-propeller protein